MSLIFREGGRGGGGVIGGRSALKKCLGLYLEGSLLLKMRDFAPENAAPK